MLWIPLCLISGLLPLLPYGFYFVLFVSYIFVCPFLSMLNHFVLGLSFVQSMWISCIWDEKKLSIGRDRYIHIYIYNFFIWDQLSINILLYSDICSLFFFLCKIHVHHFLPDVHIYTYIHIFKAWFLVILMFTSILKYF